MPALSAIRTPAIQALASELSFASKPTLMRHLQRIEQLAPLIESDGVYPQDFIVFRVTNYRPDIAEPELISGEALLSDLSALAEHLSQAAKLSVEDLPTDHETIDSLAERWGVSRKTIERYRRLGLVARRIDKGSGHRAIVFLPGPIAWFEERYGDRLNTASGFSRMDPAMSERILRDARRYKRRLNLNRTHISQRIAQRIGRSPEPVRRVLIAHDDACSTTGNTPIFNRPPPASAPLQRTMLTQSLQGKRTGTIAALHGRTAISVSRSINRARRALILEALSDSTPDISVVDQELLKNPIVTTELTSDPLASDAPIPLTEFIARLREHRAPVIYEQSTRAGAIAMLTNRAARHASALHPSTPSGRILDLIETDLRWITLLKASLIATQLPLMLTTIERHIGGPIDSLDPARTSTILLDAIRVVTAALDRHDPASRGTLAAPVGLAITRWSARLPDVATPPREGKAGRRIVEGHAIDPWTRVLWTTIPTLRPPALLEGLDPSADLSQRDRELLTKRYALDGNAPHSLEDLARWLDTPPLHASRMAQAALKRAHATAARIKS